MRVLLTGAAGFVGSHVARTLTAQGLEVIGVVRPSADASRLDGVDRGFSLQRADLGDAAALRAGLATWRPDVCVHLAWYAVPGTYLTAPENIESLRVTLALLEELGRAGCSRVIAVGTCAEYDTGAAKILNEDSPTRPDTLYAACKLSALLVGRERAAQLGIDLVWARIFSLYGPFEDERRMVPSLIRTLRAGDTFAATAGAQVRDYLHVSDVAAALSALAQSRITGVFNVCSGNPVRVGDLMTVLARIIGRPDLLELGVLPDREWEPAFICGDPARLRSATGWSPRFELEPGLKDTLDWWATRPAALHPPPSRP